MHTYTARTPVDLLALVPYVIGFHPEDSVVLLTFGGRGSGGDPSSFHARVDLPVVEAEQRSVAAMLREVVARHEVQSVAVLIYSDDVAASALFGSLISAGLDRDGVQIVDVLRIDSDRFHVAEDPEDPGIGYDLRSHPFTAQGVLEGRVVHENRTALRDSLIGTDAEDAQAVSDAATAFVDTFSVLRTSGQSLGEALAGQAGWLQEQIALHLADFETMRKPISSQEAARLLVLVSFEALREVAWAPMTRSTAAQHVELWRALVRRAPADLRAGASGVLAFAAWLAGDGALAWCALDRCLEAEPDDPLAQYVAALVESATPPSVWAPVPDHSLRIFTAFGAGYQRS